MRIRFREHELTLVSLLAAMLMGASLITAWNQGAEEIGNGYFVHVLVPQMVRVLLPYFCYLIFNFRIVPLVRKLILERSAGKTAMRLQIVLLFALIIGLFFAGSYYFSYHQQPPWIPGGSPFSFLAVIMIYVGYAFVREMTIYWLEKPGPKQASRIMGTNEAGIFLTALISIGSFLTIFRIEESGDFYDPYFAFALPALAVYLMNTYSLFPQNEGKSFLRFPIILRLLMTTFFASAFGFFIAPHNHLSPAIIPAIWLVQLFIITPVSWLAYQQKKDKILQLSGIEKKLVQSNADLQFLRSQINPHFLFNALNTLYGTALEEHSEKTAAGIQQLGDMMRFMLHENHQDFIPLSKEIDYLNNYISLQQLRLPEHSDIEIIVQMDEAVDLGQIVPMLLIPFVENAFKHGISLREKSWIHMLLRVDDTHLYFELNNSMHERKGENLEKEKSGIGLQNVSERLNLMYGDRYELSYEGDGKTFSVSLSLPLYQEKVPARTNL